MVCLCFASTEEEAGKEAFAKVIGIPVRHLETLLGGGAPNVRALVPAFQKLTVCWGTKHTLGFSQGESKLRCRYAHVHTSWGPRYVQMALSVSWPRELNKGVSTKMKTVILNWKQFCLPVLHCLETFFWSHFGHNSRKEQLSSCEQRSGML